WPRLIELGNQLDQGRNVFLTADQQDGVGPLEGDVRHLALPRKRSRIDLVDHGGKRGAIDVLQIEDLNLRLELQALLLDLFDDLEHAIDVFFTAADDDHVVENFDLHVVDAGDGLHRGSR